MCNVWISQTFCHLFHIILIYFLSPLMCDVLICQTFCPPSSTSFLPIFLAPWCVMFGLVRHFVTSSTSFYLFSDPLMCNVWISQTFCPLFHIILIYFLKSFMGNDWILQTFRLLVHIFHTSFSLQNCRLLLHICHFLLIYSVHYWFSG